MLHKTGTRAVETEGLTTQQWAVLGALSRPEAADGMNVGDLARYLMVSRQNLAGLLSRMERDGHIAVSPDTRDRRSRIVSMTKSGRHVWDVLAQPGSDPVHKVSIIPRGIGALGYTIQRPTEDRYLMTRAELERKIAVLLGGRAAEVLVLGELSTGAADDIAKATDIAREMVTRYGMTDALGPMVYAENEGEVFLGRSVTKTTNMSEQTMQKVDAEVRRIIDQQYTLARKLIEDNQDKMHAMAKALLEWETIDSDQLDDIMAGKEPRAPKDWTPRSSASGGDSGSGGAPAVKPDPTPTAA